MTPDRKPLSKSRNRYEANARIQIVASMKKGPLERKESDSRKSTRPLRVIKSNKRQVKKKNFSGKRNRLTKGIYWKRNGYKGVYFPRARIKEIAVSPKVMTFSFREL